MAALKQFPWREVLGYLLAIFILTFPLITDPVNFVVGHVQATSRCHVWIIWWAQQHFTHPDTDLLFYPYGSNLILLYGSDLLSPMLFSIINIPPPLAFNMWIVGLLLFGAMGIRRLCLFMGADSAGAFLGGLFFCSSAFFQHEIFNGTSEMIASGFLPWYSLMLLRFIQQPSKATALALGLLVGLAVTASVYNAFFILVISACVFGHRMCTSIEPFWTKLLLWRATLSLSIAAPFLTLVAYVHLRFGSVATLERRENWLNPEKHLPDSFADVLDFIDPRAAEIPKLLFMRNDVVFSYWTTCTVYLGWLGIFALLYGWWTKKSVGKYQSILRILLVVSLLMALGPYLRVGGSMLMVAGEPVKMPIYSVAYLFPFIAFSALHAYRYTTIAILALSCIVGTTLRRLSWALLILFEALILSPVPYPAAVSPMVNSVALERLAEEPAGAVLHGPLLKENLHDIGLALNAQIYHGKPIQDGGIHRRAKPYSAQLFATSKLVDGFSKQDAFQFIQDSAARKDAEILYKLGYRYVLIPASEKSLVTWMDSWLGEAVVKDEKWVYWRLSDAWSKVD